MNRVPIPVLSVLLALTASASGAAGSPAGEIRSEAPGGSITLAADGPPTGMRLAVRLAAYNRGATPASLASADVAVATAGGATLRLVPLQQLEAEARASLGQPGGGLFQAQSTRNDNAAIHDSTGNVVEGAYGGAAAGPSPAEQAVREQQLEQSNPRLAQQLSALRAGILQSMDVPPGHAAGALLVIDKVRFGRKDARTLIVTVRFNGDVHRIELPVPAEGR